MAVKSYSTDYRVIISSPVWSLNGANISSEKLIRGFLERNMDATLLLTDRHRPDPKLMAIPTDIPVEDLPVRHCRNWDDRWNVFIKYLEDCAPCIYMPTYDYAYSCVCPRLSDRVGVVGIVHSDDPEHYEHVGRMGAYWNATVTKSEEIKKKIALTYPSLVSRLVFIPNGVTVPNAYPKRQWNLQTPLRIAYAGGLKQHQKRIFDFPNIMRALLKLNATFEFTIIGGGPNEKELRSQFSDLIDKGLVKFEGILPNAEVLKRLKEQDVFLMTSEFEGMSNALLESMAQGCVPVVTATFSGTEGVIEDGVNGYLVPVGDIDLFAQRLAELRINLSRREELSNKAYASIKRSNYSIDRMVLSYISLFQRIMDDASHGIYCRRKGKIIPPPFMAESSKKYSRPRHAVAGSKKLAANAAFPKFLRRVIAKVRILHRAI